MSNVAHIQTSSDDKLKLGVGEKVTLNTKRMIHSCMEFERLRVSKATAGSVYLRGRASELLIEGHRFDSYWEHSKFFFSEYQACIICSILNIILSLSFLYQKCIYVLMIYFNFFLSFFLSSFFLLAVLFFVSFEVFFYQ